MGEQADEVGHRSAGREEACFFSQALRSHRLETFDGGVVTQRVIANLGRGHRFSHAGGGFGNGIAAQVHNALSGCHRVLPPFRVRYGSVPFTALISSLRSSHCSSCSTASSVLSDTPMEPRRSWMACQTPDSFKVRTLRGQEKATMRSGAAKRGRRRINSRKRSSELRTRSTTRTSGGSASV